MKVYKDANLDMRFDLNDKVMIGKFLKNYVLLKETAQFTGGIELLSPKGVMLDLSEVEDMENYAKSILEDDLTLQLKGHGVRKFALVKSRSDKLNNFVMSLFEGDKKPEKLEIAEFDSADDALIWLKS